MLKQNKPLAVFITGASSGIGEALARKYAKRGANLGLVARREAALYELQASLPYPNQHQIYPLDVTNHADLKFAALDFIAKHGQVDVVIANAGVSQGTLSGSDDDLSRFERIVATNLMALVATFSPFIADIKYPNKTLHLVGIASVAGIRGIPGAGAYCASKAAVINYCESLRIELRSTSIKVVTIAPGYVATPLTKKNRFPMPFLIDAECFATKALAAIDKGHSYVVIPWQMNLVAKLLRLMPNAIFDRLIFRSPRKNLES